MNREIMLDNAHAGKYLHYDIKLSEIEWKKREKIKCFKLPQPTFIYLDESAENFSKKLIVENMRSQMIENSLNSIFDSFHLSAYYAIRHIQ